MPQNRREKRLFILVPRTAKPSHVSRGVDVRQRKWGLAHDDPSRLRVARVRGSCGPRHEVDGIKAAALARVGGRKDQPGFASGCALKQMKDCFLAVPNAIACIHCSSFQFAFVPSQILLRFLMGACRTRTD